MLDAVELVPRFLESVMSLAVEGGDRSTFIRSGHAKVRSRGAEDG